MKDETRREDDGLPQIRGTESNTEAEPRPEIGHADVRDRVKHDPGLPGRRSFLGVMLGAGAAVVGTLMAIPLVRFALYPVFAKASAVQWSEVGPADFFRSLPAPVQRMVTVSQLDGWRESVSQKAVYVTQNAQGKLQVLSAVCPHLGCEVPWNPGKKQFFCPCHGSVFGADGARISGPTPRGLDSLSTTVQNGQLMVRYQYFRQLLPDKEVAD